MATRTAPRAPRAVARLTRAAMFYLGATTVAACGGDGATPEPRPDPVVQPYGAPPEPPETIAQPYGAPPEPDPEPLEEPPSDVDPTPDEQGSEGPREEAAPEGEATEPEAAVVSPQPREPVLAMGSSAYGGPPPGLGLGLDGLGTPGPRPEQARGRVAISAPPTAGADITRQVRTRVRAIQSCYRRELMSRPGLEGLVRIEFTVQPTGRVSAASIVTNTTGRDALGRCALVVIQRIRFPPTATAESHTFGFAMSPEQ